jgi:NADH:ubiquinone oxidoreductase subunit
MAFEGDPSKPKVERSEIWKSWVHLRFGVPPGRMHLKSQKNQKDYHPLGVPSSRRRDSEIIPQRRDYRGGRGFVILRSGVIPNVNESGD